MQLYAKTAQTTTKKEALSAFVSKDLLSISLISADQAKRQQDYFCPECDGIVRLRAGEQRLKHFYHLAKSAHCRQQNKSLEHIQTQRLIQEKIGFSLCRLEVPFPQINRIADVVWEEEKIIFEVQCSPMTASEARSRIADYARAGYQVVFILHDKRFNQYRLSALEAALRGSPCYFSDISKEGVGQLYDQFDQIAHGCRIKCLARLPIDIESPKRLLNLKQIESFHLIFKKRLEASSCILYFQGDLLSLAECDPNSLYIEEALQLEMKQAAECANKRNQANKTLLPLFYRIKQQLKQAGHLLWRHLLEKSGSK